MDDINNQLSELESFVNDIECLNEITERMPSFNMFEVLNIQHRELQHSNMLAWLLNPTNPHGSSDLMVKYLINYTLKHPNNYINRVTGLKLQLSDYSDLVIKREWHNIDLFLESKNNDLIILIENKIWSGETGNQLKNYDRFVSSNYYGYNIIRIFLTPAGHPASEDGWINVSYGELLKFLDNVIENDSISMPEDAKLFIQQYRDILRRNIVGDKELEEICHKIYFKHQKALDIIFNNIPDMSRLTLETIINCLVNNGFEVLENKDPRYINFLTPNMKELIPQSAVDWVEGNYILTLEIQNFDKPNLLELHIVIGTGNINDRKKIKDFADIHTYFESPNLNNKWPRIFKNTILNLNNTTLSDNLSLNNMVSKTLNNYLQNNIFKNVINELEEELKKFFHK